MTKRMLIDTTHAEETRVVVLDGNRLDDYDVETSAKRQIKGNIYLAKIVRIEPSLQAAFVEYGGNRHGFLAFAEIHPDYYQIPVADRERLIALQEEEARAEEARADRDEDEPEADGRAGGEDDGGRASGRDDPRDEAGDGRDDVVETTAQALPEEDADGVQDHAPGAMALAMPAETRHGNVADDAGAEAGADGPAAADAEAGAEAEVSGPDEPAPETVGGETVDDGHAQRRTARFLRQYKIQEVMRRRQILLIQVVKEERGNKGAALTTYISLAGRFCVLMPNSLRGGGVSRKITSAADRRRLKEITAELAIPRGMAMIVRTAGAQRPRPEIKRDCEYLLRTWDDIRETTLQSIAPCLVYEEASLIKRAIRDVYTRDIEEILVDGEPGWKGAREFMRTLMPTNAGRVNLWRDPAQTLFSHYQVEHHLDAMLQPTVQLRSGGYLVINQTEALVAIDVNSGRSTRERSVEDTALRTNMEAADEVARQLRLRDLAGLIVIDFIDMDVRRNNAMVERRLKDALRHDRARIQVGTISHFGLMEMSRQRLRPSLAESSFVACPHCNGSGYMRGTESSALHVLRAIEEEAGRRKAGELVVHVAAPVALYVLNNKRAWLQEIEARQHVTVQLAIDDALVPPALRIDKTRPYAGPPLAAPVARIPIEAMPTAAEPDDEEGGAEEEPMAARAPVAAAPAADAAAAAGGEEGERRGKRRRRRRRGGRREDGSPLPEDGAEAAVGHSRPEPGDEFDEDEPADRPNPGATPGEDGGVQAAAVTGDGDQPAGRGRRRRGGRNRTRPETGSQTGSQDGRNGGAGGGADALGLDDPLDAPRPAAPRAYDGPTPANPFAGSYDIFEMMERESDETLGLAREPSASAASLATPQPRPIPEPEPEPFLDVGAGPTGTPSAGAATEPEQAAADLADGAVAPTEPAAAGVAEDAAVAEPGPVLPPDVAEVPAAEAPAAKARRPRAPRARKTAAIEVADAAPDAASEEAVPEVPKVKPVRARTPRPKRAAAAPAEPAPGTPDPEPDAAGPVGDEGPPAQAGQPGPAATEAAASEPAAGAAEAVGDEALPPAEAGQPGSDVPPGAPDEPTAGAAGGADPSIVRPIVIGGEAPAAARRTGWWKR